MSFEQMLNDTCTITHLSASGFDSLGDPTTTTTTQSNVSTRIYKQSNFYTQDGKVLNARTLKAFFKPSVTVQLQDTITIGSKTYIVTDIDDVDNYGSFHHLEVIIEEMVNG